MIAVAWFHAATSASAAELVVWHAYRGEEAAAVEAVAQAWTARTGEPVEMVALPFGGFDAKVETAIPRGNGPDVFLAAHGNLGKWVAMGLVEPWDGPLDDYLPATVGAMRLDAQAWGVPIAF